jgi:hypothetical protein
MAFVPCLRPLDWRFVIITNLGRDAVDARAQASYMIA